MDQMREIREGQREDSMPQTKFEGISREIKAYIKNHREMNINKLVNEITMTFGTNISKRDIQEIKNGR